MSPLIHVKEHASLSQSYLAEAASSIENGLAPEAGEALCKSISEGIRAVAASRGLNLRSEGSVWDYASVLAAGIDDTRAFPRAFYYTYLLYSDAYEGHLTLESWRPLYKNTADGVADLLSMASRDGGQ